MVLHLYGSCSSSSSACLRSSGSCARIRVRPLRSSVLSSMSNTGSSGQRPGRSAGPRCCSGSCRIRASHTLAMSRAPVRSRDPMAGRVTSAGPGPASSAAPPALPPSPGMITRTFGIVCRHLFTDTIVLWTVLRNSQAVAGEAERHMARAPAAAVVESPAATSRKFHVGFSDAGPVSAVASLVSRGRHCRWLSVPNRSNASSVPRS
jgi:hypothetical protein